jgi:hypothetical protein
MGRERGAVSHTFSQNVSHSHTCSLLRFALELALPKFLRYNDVQCWQFTLMAMNLRGSQRLPQAGGGILACFIRRLQANCHEFVWGSFAEQYRSKFDSRQIAVEGYKTTSQFCVLRLGYFRLPSLPLHGGLNSLPASCTRADHMVP